MPEPVVVAGCRTVIGTPQGYFAQVPATRLGGVAIREALRRARLDGGDVDAVFMGHADQAGAGPNPARLAAARAGIPLGVPATTLNGKDLSGLHAVALAALLVETGQCDIVVAGGMESASTAPSVVPRHLTESTSPPSRRYRRRTALGERPRPVSPGAATFAATSRERAAAAWATGLLAAEVVPVLAAAPHRSDRKIIRGRDEALGFWGQTCVDGSSTPLPSDGAAALVVMERQRAHRLGLPLLASLGAQGRANSSAGAPPVAQAVDDALRRDGGLTARDITLFEIHEESAQTVTAAAHALDIAEDRVNPNGGALALGHPAAMSGVRMVLTLAYELRRRGGGAGVVAAGGDNGQGESLLLTV